MWEIKPFELGPIAGTRWSVIDREPDLRVTRDEKGVRHRRAFWKCRCECGTERFVSGQSLSHKKRGVVLSQSCGCWRKEFAQNLYRKHVAQMTPPVGCVRDSQGKWKVAA